MEVVFRNRQLQRRFESGADAIRAWGPFVGRRYVERVRTIRNASSLQALHRLRALDLHPLTGDRSGQYAIRLTGQMPLIVTVASDEQVIIEEVVDYHG